MDQKAAVTLTKEKETLLIPLYGRANAHRYGLPDDPLARQLLDHVDYDFSRLRIPAKIQIFMMLRSLLLDRSAADYLRQNPGAQVLSLGSGLDARCCRLEGYSRWLDLDFPQVIALRQALFGEILPSNAGAIGASVTEEAWLDALEPDAGPVLVIMEGLLMYLRPQEVASLLRRLCAKFPHCRLVFDAYSHQTVRGIRFQPSLGRTQAKIYWGADTAAEIQALCPGLQFEQKIHLTDAPEIAALPGWYRKMFAFAGRFSAAREAHRIFVFTATGPPNPTID